METLTFTIGTRVAKGTNGTYATGTVTDTKDNKSLVRFESLGYSRWINNANID